MKHLLGNWTVCQLLPGKYISYRRLEDAYEEREVDKGRLKGARVYPVRIISEWVTSDDQQSELSDGALLQMRARLPIP